MRTRIYNYGVYKDKKNAYVLLHVVDRMLLVICICIVYIYVLASRLMLKSLQVHPTFGVWRIRPAGYTYNT